MESVLAQKKDIAVLVGVVDDRHDIRQYAMPPRTPLAPAHVEHVVHDALVDRYGGVVHRVAHRIESEVAPDDVCGSKASEAKRLRYVNLNLSRLGIRVFLYLVYVG